MTLGNMRENGVRSLFAYCRACHHEAIMNVDKYDAACHVPSFGPRNRQNLALLRLRRGSLWKCKSKFFAECGTFDLGQERSFDLARF